MRPLWSWAATLLLLALPGGPSSPARAAGCDLSVLAKIKLENPPALPAAQKAVVERLRTIHAARDLAAFEALIDPQAEMSLGGHEGLEGFRAIWTPARKGGTAHLWRTLDQIMRFPAGSEAEEAGTILWPWFFAKFPDEVDAFALLIARPGSRLWQQPGGEVAAELSSLTPLLMRPAASDKAPGPWILVDAPGHCAVFARADDVHALVGARLSIARDTAGQWRIVTFVEGD